MRADVIGQPQVFADAQEQSRTQIAAGLLQKFQWIPIIALQGCARKADDHDGLLLVAGFDNAFLLFWKSCLWKFAERFGAAFPGGEFLFHCAPGDLRVDVAEDCENAILWNGQLLVEPFQFGNGEVLNTGLGSQ